MTRRPTLRAGLFGLGMMGRHHARILRNTPGIELVGVCDPMGDPLGVAGGAPFDVDPERLIGRELDCAVVAVPTDEHLPIGLLLAAAGVPTLIEKPLAVDLPGARELVAAFEGTVAAVGHVERSNAAVRALRTRLDQGELGAVYQVATSRQGPFPDRIRDVGVVKDLATHDLDLVEWVTGQTFGAVSAVAAHRAGRPFEDLVVITGTVGDGIVATSQVNWLSPFKERRVTVLGESGCFIADTLTADLTFAANGVVHSEWDAISKFRGVAEGDVIRYAIPKPEPLAVQMEAFRDAVLGEGVPTMPIRAGLRVLAVADAAVRSAGAGGEPVVPEDV
ncbi:MAG TPA: Gfo/Idh/MocA family oxidoreductase [Nocardioides sp.]|nr:Gfo/Idh/MocA family oxidoreductase [Nocardioides sp.]